MRLLLAVLGLSIPCAIHAGGENMPVGARIAGMGQAGITLIDLWSVHHNQAGLAGLLTPTAGAFYQRHFLSEELSHQGLAFTLPLGRGTLAVSGSSMGYSLYREGKYGLAYAMRFGDGLRVGVQMDYLTVRFGEEYGSRGMVTAEVGVQARITDELWIGAHLYNPTRAELGGPYQEETPAILRAGLGYTFSPRLAMTGEVVKDVDRPERFQVGLEYQPHSVLFLRTGVGTGPTQGHFGLGVRMGGVDVNLAVAFRSRLGPTPMIDLAYRFQ